MPPTSLPSYQISGFPHAVVLALLGLTWLAWPLWLWSGWRLRSAGTRLRGAAWSLLFLATSLFIEARFIEPNCLIQRDTPLQLGFKARIAVISDYHLGMYKGPDFLDHVVDRLNALDVDAVLIAGDHLFLPDRPLVELLAPLRRLKHPVYSVPGNHDDKLADPQRGQDLYAALLAVGVTPLEYSHAELARFTLVGLGDLRAGHDGRGPLQHAPRDKPVVVFFHNPDTAPSLQPNDAALAIAGHTHGGQVRIPWLYRRFLPVNHPFDRGLHTFPPVPTFVTSGLGESGLPLRLFNPPVIDVLEIE